ncbi:hypothetical protein V2G26_019243 [Clonostachys chloroleuca]
MVRRLPTMDQLRSAFGRACWAFYVIFLKVRNRQRQWWDDKRYDKRSAQKLGEKCFSSRPHPQSTTTQGPRSFFTRIPPEIRRRILVEAFGQQTIHLDLTFWWKPGWRSPTWVWFNWICHSDKPGQLHPWRWKERREGVVNNRLIYESGPRNPLDCPRSAGAAAPHRGRCRRKCHVGASGWLLSCRQANMEGLEVLYRTNTICIDSPILLNGLQDILSLEKLSFLTSLEITVTPILHPAYFFEGLYDDSRLKQGSILFPSMRQLHFVIDHHQRSSVNYYGVVNYPILLGAWKHLTI